MKGNPLLPYAFLAIIGIALMLIFSFQGIKQEKELTAAQTGGAAPQAAANPEEIVKQTCTSCHGANLEGSVGPNLQKIGSKYSQDEIKAILMNGRGNMPAGLVTSDVAAKVAAYLEGKK
ncbi:cytochrome c550 [Ectobacillus sp. sgz5001026]|uniref:cytochrome c550 n=1 Tax=Ectobacillus sp. sgz5001026 TaxID=3242473 RepID=UPI0036D3F0ED